MPLTKDGRLSAKEFIGNRTQMTADQTSFAEAVRHLGLERGVEGQKRATRRFLSITKGWVAIRQKRPI